MKSRKNQNGGFTLIELLAVLFIAIIIFTLAGTMLGGCGRQGSEGARVGQVTKLSFRGLAFKSYEGELLMGSGVRAVAGIGGNIWEFSLPKDETAVLAKLQAALDSGKIVKVSYKAGTFYNPLRQFTPYVVTDVQELSTNSVASP